MRTFGSLITAACLATLCSPAFAEAPGTAVSPWLEKSTPQYTYTPPQFPGADIADKPRISTPPELSNPKRREPIKLMSPAPLAVRA